MAEKFTQKEVDEMIDMVYENKNKNEDDDENENGEKMNQYLNSKKIKTYDVLSPEEIDALVEETEESYKKNIQKRTKMKLVEYYRNGKVNKGIEIIKDELTNIYKKLNYVSISKADKENIEKLTDNEIVGTIMGNINNIIYDLDLFNELNLKDKEIPICENPDCWFVNKDYMKSNYKPLVPDTLFKFGEAIELMKLGYKVARIGWNEKNEFIFLAPREFSRKVEEVSSRWSDYKIDDFIVIATAQKTFQPGWSPSQVDMLADDWIIKNEL